jgi:hypothetical protein
MIIAKMMGNLGNQLFIYAFCRSLQLDSGEDLYFDLSGLKRYYYTAAYKLDEFCLPDSVSYDLSRLPVSIRKKFSHWTTEFHVEQKICRNFESGRITPLWLVKHWEKRNCAFDFSGFTWRQFSFCSDSPKMVYGYFQSDKYFEKHDKTLRGELQLKDAPNSYDKFILSQTSASNSIGVSIRTRYDKRGDCYVLPDYYVRAMKKAASLVGNPHFFIFSDNIEKARELIPLFGQVTYVNQPDSAKQMMLLSSCKNFVLTNSTFSWWGAYLSKNKNKFIIMPFPWFKGGSFDDIYISKSIKVPCVFAK